MQCKCGGGTQDHEVVEKKVVVGVYPKCTWCGRIYWLWDNREKKREKKDD